MYNISIGKIITMTVKNEKNLNFHLKHTKKK